MSQRQQRVAERIKEEVGEIICKKIKDPRIGFVTIIRVELTADLKSAKIFYSVLGSSDKKQQAKEGLKSAEKYIRCLLGELLKLRCTPEISFKVDEYIEKSIHMQEIFDKIAQERVDKNNDQ